MRVTTYMAATLTINRSTHRLRKKPPLENRPWASPELALYTITVPKPTRATTGASGDTSGGPRDRETEPIVPWRSQCAGEGPDGPRGEAGRGLRQIERKCYQPGAWIGPGRPSARRTDAG